MNTRLKKLMLFAFLFLVASIAHATTRSVLFIGNSYIFTNNMPLMLQNMATAMGDTLVYDESDPGGYTFLQHTTYGPTLTKLTSKKWDIVILQEQSQRPSFSPSQVATDVYPYAHTLDSMIKDNDSCTQTMFLMTWGRASGDAMNCPSYPPVCTYAGMQYRLRESYLEMTKDNMAVVAPVGAAWKTLRDSFTTPWLYVSDDSHPTVSGSYLEACVLYASIFHKPVFGCSYTSGLPAGDVQIMQRIADRVTLDSIGQWQQYGHYPYAGFKKSVSGLAGTFTSLSPVPATYSWKFGDGAVAAIASPVHTYTAPGTYTVSQTAANKCFTETITSTVKVGSTTATGNQVYTNSALRITLQGNGAVLFVLPDAHKYDVVEVLDSKGSCIRRYTQPDQQFTDKFVPGFYMVRGYSSDRQNTFINKLIIY